MAVSDSAVANTEERFREVNWAVRSLYLECQGCGQTRTTVAFTLKQADRIYDRFSDAHQACKVPARAGLPGKGIWMSTSYPFSP